MVKEYTSVTRKVRLFCSCSNPLAFCIKMSHKIKDIKERVDKISYEGGKLGLIEIDRHHDNDQSLTLSWRETHSMLPSHVTGRDQEKEEIIWYFNGTAITS